MAECCVRSPARTFCQESSLIEEVPGLANAPRTEGGQCKKSIPAGSWPFSPQEHLSSSLQCLPQLPCPPPRHPCSFQPPFQTHKSQGLFPWGAMGVLPALWLETASEYWGHSRFSHITEILPFQLWNPFMSKSDFEFFFLLFRHISFWNVFVPLGLSQTLPLLTLKSRSAWGDFSPQFGLVLWTTGGSGTLE